MLFGPVPSIRAAAHGRRKRNDMGTNYFYRPKTDQACAHCGRSDVERIHLGKHAVGWRFLLHQAKTHDGRPLKDLEAWSKYMAMDKGTIVDEYNRVYPITTFLDVVIALNDTGKSRHDPPTPGLCDLEPGRFW